MGVVPTGADLLAAHALGRFAEERPGRFVEQARAVSSAPPVVRGSQHLRPDTSPIWLASDLSTQIGARQTTDHARGREGTVAWAASTLQC